MITIMLHVKTTPDDAIEVTGGCQPTDCTSAEANLAHDIMEAINGALNGRQLDPKSVLIVRKNPVPKED